jgi:hypothetical protein
LIDFAFIEVILALKSQFNVVLRFFIDIYAFEQHFFLDTDDGFFFWIVGVELEPNFGVDCQVKAGLSDEFLEVISFFFCNVSIVHDDLLKLTLFVLRRER